MPADKSERYIAHVVLVYFLTCTPDKTIIPRFVANNHLVLVLYLIRFEYMHFVQLREACASFSYLSDIPYRPMKTLYSLGFQITFASPSSTDRPDHVYTPRHVLRKGATGMGILRSGWGRKHMALSRHKGVFVLPLSRNTDIHYGETHRN